MRSLSPSLARIQISRPCVVCTGIAASFYNPQLPGLENLALYTSTTDLPNTEALGTDQVTAGGMLKLCSAVCRGVSSTPCPILWCIHAA